MTTINRLRNALNSIDDAKRKIKRLQNQGEISNEIRRIVRELDDAEASVQRAIIELR